jgi:hypothetical protein
MPDPERSRVVLVGTSRYKNFENLPAVENNLIGMAKFLSDPEICGIIPSHVRVITKPKSPAHVLDAIYEAADSCSDTLVFYFTGHGLTSAYNDELLLATCDTDPRRPHSAIRFEDVRMAILSARKAPRKLVILDCCFSGRAMVGSMGDSHSLASRSNIEGSYILTAAAETKTALAPPGEHYTAFTGELLSLLENGSTDAGRDLDMGSVYAHLHNQLSSKSRPLPQQRNRNAGASIVLARNRAASAKRKALDSQAQQVLSHVGRSLRAQQDPLKLRSEMLAEHLPYDRRMRASVSLAKLFPDYADEAREVLANIAREPDLDPSEHVEALGNLCIVGWGDPEDTKKKLLKIATTPLKHGLVATRAKACRELLRLKERDLAKEGYMSIVMDSKAGAKLRARQALFMAQEFPEHKEAALRLMWSVSKGDEIDLADRVEVLQWICELDPASIDEATSLIKRIKKGAWDGIRGT